MGYPIEKRGVYYLARRLSSQLSLVLRGTDYNLLTKCYSIWICRDDIPEEDQYSISVYEMVNTRNTASNTVSKENYDLMTLVVIKLGNTVYNGDKEDEGYELLRFLNTIMYPHKDDFMSTVSEYIDFSDNDILREEVIRVSSIEQIKYEGMREELTKELTEELTAELTEELTAELTEELTAELTEEITAELTEEITAELTEELSRRGIQVLILNNLAEKIPRERTLITLQMYYNLTEEKAKYYYEKFTSEEQNIISV